MYSMVDFLYVIVLVITSTNTTVRVLDGNGKSTSLLPSSKVARCPKPQFLRQSSPSTEKTILWLQLEMAQALYWQLSQGDSSYQQNVGPGHDNVQARYLQPKCIQWMYRATEPGSEIFFSFQVLLELGGVSFVMIPFNIEWLVLWTVRAVNESFHNIWRRVLKHCVPLIGMLVCRIIYGWL